MATEPLSEKVSVNVNSSTLANIDLLVENGYYSNRSDFINQSLREHIQKHQSTIDRIIEKNTESSDSGPHSYDWFMGVEIISTSEIKKKYNNGTKVNITGYGALIIDEDEDISDEIIFAVIEKIAVKGKVICRKSLKQHYRLK